MILNLKCIFFKKHTFFIFLESNISMSIYFLNNPIKIMLHIYSPIEEKLNSYTHFLAAIFSFLSCTFLMSYSILVHGFNLGNLLFILLFGITSTLTFLISSKYHSETNLQKKLFLRKLDHTSIFLTIIGTFIPIAYFSIDTSFIFYLFIISELLMLIYGIYFKLKSNKCFTKHAVLVYLYMVVPFCFVLFNIVNVLPIENLIFLSLSLGMCLFGIPFYLMKSIRFTHVIWHIFVIISNIFSNILLFNILK